MVNFIMVNNNYAKTAQMSRNSICMKLIPHEMSDLSSNVSCFLWQVFLSNEACQDSITTSWKHGIMAGWKMVGLLCTCTIRYFSPLSLCFMPQPH